MNAQFLNGPQPPPKKDSPDQGEAMILQLPAEAKAHLATFCSAHRITPLQMLSAVLPEMLKDPLVVDRAFSASRTNVAEIDACIADLEAKLARRRAKKRSPSLGVAMPQACEA